MQGRLSSLLLRRPVKCFTAPLATAAVIGANPASTKLASMECNFLPIDAAGVDRLQLKGKEKVKEYCYL
jgi:hypothetical protein